MYRSSKTSILKRSSVAAALAVAGLSAGVTFAGAATHHSHATASSTHRAALKKHATHSHSDSVVGLRGVVTLVSASSITISGHEGAPSTFTIDSSTTVTLNGVAAAATDLALGQHVTIVPSTSDATIAGSIAITVKAVHARGVVTAASATSLTLQPRSHEGVTPPPVTFTIAPATVVTKGGVAASATDLAIGQNVKVVATLADPTIAATIDIRPAESAASVRGTVTVASLTSLTVQPRGDDGVTPPPVTFSIAPSTVVTEGSTTVTPAALAVGEQVTVVPSSSDATIAASVSIRLQEVKGLVSSIASGSFVVTTKHGDTLTVIVGSTTTFFTGGAASTFSALSVGAFVEAIGVPDATTPANLDALSVTFGTPSGDGHGDHGSGGSGFSSTRGSGSGGHGDGGHGGHGGHGH